MTGQGESRPTVGLVVVSHSAKLAEGVAELAAQMAPGVPIVAAGGLAAGGLGTDFDLVVAALADADRGAGVVVLFDLGSARMVADMAVEGLADPDRAVVSDAPLVSGAVAAAVAAAGGADLAVVATAATGLAPDVAASPPPTSTPREVEAGLHTGALAETVEVELVLTNEVGLHARPAALLARSLAGLDAAITIRLGAKSADARSVLALMGLGAAKGDRLTVSASGPQAPEAVDRIRRLVTENFVADHFGG